MTGKRRPTRAEIDAAIALSAARCAGTYVPPPPVMTRKASRFMPRMTARPRELAVRSATGAPIGPRGGR